MKTRLHKPIDYAWMRDILTSFIGCTLVFTIFGLCDYTFFDIIYNNPRYQRQLLRNGMTLTSFAIITGGIASALGLIMGRLIEILLLNNLLPAKTHAVHPVGQLFFEVCGLLISAFLYVVLSTRIQRHHHLTTR